MTNGLLIVAAIILWINGLYHYIKMLLNCFDIILNPDNVPMWKFFATVFFPIAGLIVLIILGMCIYSCLFPLYIELIDRETDKVVGYQKYRGIGYAKHSVISDNAVMRKYFNLATYDWKNGGYISGWKIRKLGKLKKLCRGFYVIEGEKE